MLSGHTISALPSASLELKVSLFAPTRPGRVIAEAWIEQGGRSTAFCEGRLLDADGKVLAKASSTLRMMDRSKIEAGSKAATGGRISGDYGLCKLRAWGRGSTRCGSRDRMEALAMAHRDDWNNALKDVLTSLNGERIVSVWAVEMALYGPEDAPSFVHPELEFVQASVIELCLENGGAIHVDTWQDDDEFALYPKRIGAADRLALDRRAYGTLFRVRHIDEFPLGALHKVTWTSDSRGNLQRIGLKVEGKEVTLCAGEVYENTDGSMTIHEQDESVLIFVDKDALRRTIFGQPRYSTV